MLLDNIGHTGVDRFMELLFVIHLISLVQIGQRHAHIVVIPLIFLINLRLPLSSVIIRFVITNRVLHYRLKKWSYDDFFFLPAILDKVRNFH